MPTPSAETEALLIYLRDWFRDHPAASCATGITEETLAQDVDAPLKPSGYSEYVDRFAQQSVARPALFLHAPVSSSRETQALPPLVPDRPGQWLRYDTDAGEELECKVWLDGDLVWGWSVPGYDGPFTLATDPTPELWRGPAPTAPAQAYPSLSDEAKALMWEIMNGDLTRDGAHKATGSDAEREAIAAKCVVSDGAHVWVAQECAHLVPGPRVHSSKPTQAQLDAAATLRAYFDSYEPGDLAIDVLLEGCAQANDRGQDARPAPTVPTSPGKYRGRFKSQDAWFTYTVAERPLTDGLWVLRAGDSLVKVDQLEWLDPVADLLCRGLEPAEQPGPALASRQRDRLDRIRDASTDELAALSRVYGVQVRERCAQAVQDMAQRYALMCAELDSSPEPDGVERFDDGDKDASGAIGTPADLAAVKSTREPDGTITLTTRVRPVAGAIQDFLLARGAVQDESASAECTHTQAALKALQKATGCDTDLIAQTITLRVWKAIHGIEYPTTTPSLRTAALEAATLLRKNRNARCDAIAQAARWEDRALGYRKVADDLQTERNALRRENEQLRAKLADTTEADDEIYLSALAAIYRTLTAVDDEDAAGWCSIDDVIKSAKACAGDWLAVCKLLGFEETVNKSHVTDEISKLQGAHVEICAALDLYPESTTDDILTRIAGRSARWRRVCEAFGLVGDVGTAGITDRIEALYSEILEANETLAAYCPDCDPGRSSLSATVSLLVSDVLDPAQVKRERKREQSTQSNILANARTAYVNANWRDRVYIQDCEARTEQHAREIVGKVFDRALAAKAHA